MPRLTRPFAKAVAKDKLLEPFYETSAGSNFSYRCFVWTQVTLVSQGNEYMAHKGGFTYSALNASFFEVGFKARYGGRFQEGKGKYNLFLVAFKQKVPEEEIKENSESILSILVGIADVFFHYF